MTRIFVPHDYQRPAMDHLYEHKRGALWAPMGGGKTVVTATALDNLSLTDDVYPALVLAPLRVAKTTWPDEYRKWAHLKHLRTSTITGDLRERKFGLYKKAEVFTANYEQIAWIISKCGDKWPFRTVIADEVTRLKSFRLQQGAKRAQALSKVVFGPGTRFIGLTGTPSPNGLKDLWGQTYFYDQGARLGHSYTAFLERWFFKDYAGVVQPLPFAQTQIQERLKDICLTVEGLPVDKPLFNDIYVELPPAARAQYRDMEREMFAQIGEHGIEAVNAGARTQKCSQMANGAAYYDDERNWTAVHDAKLEALDSVIEEANGAPVLVAYNFVSDLARLKARYPQGRAFDTNPQTIHDWNAGKIPILFGHPASMGHGLNLAEGGNILVFFSLDWNLEYYLQVIERVGPLRQAQAGLKRPVHVHRILAKDTVDELKLERLEGKREVQDILLDAMVRRAREE